MEQERRGRGHRPKGRHSRKAEEADPNLLPRESSALGTREKGGQVAGGVGVGRGGSAAERAGEVDKGTCHLPVGGDW